MWGRGESGPSGAGVAEQGVEPAPAVVDRAAEPVERVEIGKVERNQRCAGAGRRGADFVVEFLEPALGARDRDHMRAALGERERGGAADSARGASDERDSGCGGRIGHAWRSKDARGRAA